MSGHALALPDLSIHILESFYNNRWISLSHPRLFSASSPTDIINDGKADGKLNYAFSLLFPKDASGRTILKPTILIFLGFGLLAVANIFRKRINA